MVAPPHAPDTAIDSHVHVETPENVWLSFRPAGLGPRMWAYFIDALIRLGVLIVIVIIGGLIMGRGDIFGVSNFVIFMSIFALEWLVDCSDIVPERGDGADSVVRR